MLLSAENLCFSYPGRPVIENLSFSLAEGGRLIVCGPNGCGKTTLLKLILGLLKPDSGRMTLREGLSVSYCKQDFPNLDFPISAAEVVKMGLYKHRTADENTAVRRAMEKTGCAELADRLFSSLSGGERQRVSLARCFCQNANLVLLDEPSSFLDSGSRNTLCSLLSTLGTDDFAVIAVTHDSEVFRSLGWRELRLGGSNG